MPDKNNLPVSFNSLSHFLAHVRIDPDKPQAVPKPEHQPALPAPRATPRPQQNQVVRETPRVPVNKQAAMVIRPATSWLSQPPPMPPETLPNPFQKQLDEARAELKTERNAHAATRDDLGCTRQRLQEALRRVAALEAQVENLYNTLSRKLTEIAQLEDLKL
jgi:hypothetical protein